MAATVAGNESVNGPMTACNEESNGRKQRNNQPTMGAVKADVGDGGDGNSKGSGGGGSGG